MTIKEEELLNDFFAGAKKEFGMERDHEDFEQITTLPYGFKNSCWKNAASPSLSYLEEERSLADDTLEVHIWIDAKNEDLRECNEGGQFVLEIVSVSDRYFYVSDSWKEICDMAPKALILADDIHSNAKFNKRDNYDLAFGELQEKAQKEGFVYEW